MEDGNRASARARFTNEDYHPRRSEVLSQPAASVHGGQHLSLLSTDSQEYIPTSAVDNQYGYAYSTTNYLPDHDFQQQQQQQQHVGPQLYQMSSMYEQDSRSNQLQFQTFAHHPVDGSSPANVHEYQQQFHYGYLSQLPQRQTDVTPILPSQGEAARPHSRPNSSVRRRDLSASNVRESYRSDISHQGTLYPGVPQTSAVSYCGAEFRGLSDGTQAQPTERLGSGDGLNALRQSYNALMRQTLEHLTNDDLTAACVSLRELSRSLLTRLEELGLAYDDYEQQDSRLRLWQNFNYCWLGLLQRQLDLSQEVETQNVTVNRVNLIDHASLQAMGNELIKYCDAIEHWALVDYEQGVWEDQIIELLVQCLEATARREAVSTIQPVKSNEPADSNERQERI